MVLYKCYAFTFFYDYILCILLSSLSYFSLNALLLQFNRELYKALFDERKKNSAHVNTWIWSSQLIVATLAFVIIRFSASLLPLLKLLSGDGTFC